MNTFRFKQNGTNVIIISDGHFICEIPWQTAQEISKALLSVSKLAEAYDNVEATIKDQALLLRKGFPMNLVSDKKALEEAYKNAYWSKDMRKISQGLTGIPSEEKVGRPIV